jgi:4-alpha-glucanotransferase
MSKTLPAHHEPPKPVGSKTSPYIPLEPRTSSSKSLPPLWSYFPSQKLAGLDIHSPWYLRNPDGSGGDLSSLLGVIKLAADAKFSIIQLNPISDTGNFNSPYMSIGSCSFDPVYLSGKLLSQMGFIANSQKIPTQATKLAQREQNAMFLKEVFAKLNSTQKHNFQTWLQTCPSPQKDYALFKVLLDNYQKLWPNWPDHFKNQPTAEILKANPMLTPEYQKELFVQYVLELQWLEVKKACQANNIYLCLDKPIYPQPNSADVWANPEAFYLDPTGRPTHVSGSNSPGDPFGEQIWNQAVYKFNRKPELVKQVIFEQIEFLAKITQVIRLDHTIAYLWKYYKINKKTGKGKYHSALKTFLPELKRAFPGIYFIAEDVGFIDYDTIDKPLQELDIPGMRCPQWSSRERYVRLSNYPQNSVALTSNHDLPSFKYWWKNLPKEQQKAILIKLNLQKNQDVVRAFTSQLFNGPSFTTFVSLRDVLGDDRMYNVPGTKDKLNWQNTLKKPLAKSDFDLISKLILDTSRKIASPLPTLIGFSPQANRNFRLEPGQYFSFMIATTELPQKLEFHTNLAILRGSKAQEWTKHTISIKDKKIKIDDYQGFKILKLSFKVPPDHKDGKYEIALNINYRATSTVPLYSFEENPQVTIKSRS